MKLIAGCRSNETATARPDTQNPDIAPTPLCGDNMRGEDTANMLPCAVIYRTNGNYNNHVTVTLDATHTSFVSHPAPADVSSSSSPLVMADG